MNTLTRNVVTFIVRLR